MDHTMFETEGITRSERFLHTPGEAALDHLIYVQELGRLQSIRPHRCIRENLDSYLLFIVVKGSGVIQIQDREYPLVMGNCVFVDCRQHYEHQSGENDPWELMWVHCNGKNMKFFHDLFLEKNDERSYITVECADKVESYFKQLIRIQKEQEILAEIKSSVLIEQIMGCLIEEAICQKEDNSHAVYNQVREYLNENYQKQALVKQAARVFQLDEEALDREFQKLYGIDIYDYVLNRRFTKAKELLRFTIKPVSEIVEISGIRNDDLFRKLFKEHEKMSAEEYRKKWAQWVK